VVVVSGVEHSADEIVEASRQWQARGIAAPQPQAEPVAWSDAADWLERESAAVYGVCISHHAEAANWLREAAPQPQPQASAEDVALVDDIIFQFPGAREAWERIRASLGVGRE
jgi:hypothetical protein